MICIPLSADSNAGMLGLLERAAREAADLYELRLDALREPARVEELVKAADRPVIATCRSVAEGGGFAGSGGERREILRRAVAAGAAYIDAETDDLALLDVGGARGSVVRIASLHDFSGTPADLQEKMRRLADLPIADWVKFAVAARRYADNLRVFEALLACPKPAIGIAMGGFGLLTRILGRRFGSRVTFGSLDAGLESAPGQPTARDLAELYRVNAVTGKTAVFVQAGSRPGEPGGALHASANRAFAAAGLDAVCIPFTGGDARDFFDTLERLEKMGNDAPGR